MSGQAYGMRQSKVSRLFMRHNVGNPALSSVLESRETLWDQTYFIIRSGIIYKASLNEWNYFQRWLDQEVK